MKEKLFKEKIINLLTNFLLRNVNKEQEKVVITSEGKLLENERLTPNRNIVITADYILDFSHVDKGNPGSAGGTMIVGKIYHVNNDYYIAFDIYYLFFSIETAVIKTNKYEVVEDFMRWGFDGRKKWTRAESSGRPTHKYRVDEDIEFKAIEPGRRTTREFSGHHGDSGYYEIF